MANNPGGIDQSIQELLAQLVPHHHRPLVCTVKAVNGMACDVQPLNDESEILNVRLVAHQADNVFIKVPAVGSFVVVDFLTNEDAYVSMVSTVTEIWYKIGTVYYSVTSAGHLIKKGETTLLTAITKIIEAVQQIAVLYGNNPDYTKLLEAQNDLNNLLR